MIPTQTPTKIGARAGGAQMSEWGLTIEERLRRRTILRPSGCLEWVNLDGSPAVGGYGVMTVKHQTYRVHRLAWSVANHRPIPEGKVILHSCDNPPCCEPTHLRPGTQAQNIGDREAKGRGRSGCRNREKTHCPQRHEYTVENTYVDREGHRHCKICRRERNRAWSTKAKA